MCKKGETSKQCSRQKDDRRQPLAPVDKVVSYMGKAVTVKVVAPVAAPVKTK